MCLRWAQEDVQTSILIPRVTYSNDLARLESNIQNDSSHIMTESRQKIVLHILKMDTF